MIDFVISLLDEFRRNVRIADIIDMLLIAVVLYWAMVWLRETASRAVAVGVSILTVVYFAARALDMYLTSLAFQTALAVLLIAMIVVFQEDLRRMFERLAALGSLGRLRSSKSTATDVSGLVEAVFHLANKKTGALIVLPGNEPLDRHLDGGIRLDGQLSKPLLYSIFDPGSPGHDGAIVLSTDRVEQFGVHLPISKNQQEIRGRGTRHSAALGLSECSDSLTIVVSEERGVVSVARQGKLEEQSETAALQKRLHEYLEEKFPQQRETIWRRYVARHAPLKLLAVVMAVCAWILLAYNPSTLQRTFIVPIEYRNLSNQLILSEFAPTEARLTLSGSERQFRFIEPGRFKLSLDMSKAKAGVTEISISENDIRPATDLNVYRIEPRLLELQLMSKQNK